MTKPTPAQALERAIKTAGGQAALAEKLGITQAAVALWKAAGAVPVKRAPAIEQFTGVSRHELRPDFFGRAA